MRFSANLKKYLSGLILTGTALWFVGCSESASTPKLAPSPSGATSPKVNSDGSVSAARESTAAEATSSSSSSSSGDEEKPRVDGDDEQAGSTTGRDVPEAAPPKDE
jgi:hypothetical protein